VSKSAVSIVNRSLRSDFDSAVSPAAYKMFAAYTTPARFQVISIVIPKRCAQAVTTSRAIVIIADAERIA